jgi:hypothetical protein
MDDLSKYNSMKDALSGSIHDQNPQLYDEVNDKATYAKGLVEGTGNLMTTHAVVGTVKKLKNSGSVLEKLGLSQEDLDGFAEDINNGNGQDVLAALSKKIINKGSARLQGALNKLMGRSDNIEAPDPQPPTGGTETPSDLDLLSPEDQASLFQAETPRVSTAVTSGSDDVAAANEAVVGAVGTASRQASIDQASAAASRAATLGADPEDVAGRIAADVGSKAEDFVSGAVKAEDVLKAATTASEVADESPVGLVVTAALGVASLVGGLFVKTHHNAYEVPNVAGVKSYAASQGIDF